MSGGKHIPSDVEYLDEHASRLAELFQKHRGRIVIYTGAGVSTSANIPDYRGTNGIWRAQQESESVQVKGKKKTAATLKLRLPEATFAQPTFTHMAISTLLAQGYVRHVVSQNVDGLHLRSGIPRDRLSELHGNLFIEQCIACNQLVYRSFDVGETTAKSRHLTGRICPYCSCQQESHHVVSSLSVSLANEVNAFLASHSGTTSISPRLLQLQAAKHAAQRLVRTTPKTSPPPPLLRDVIVHYYERQPQAGLPLVYRILPALKAVHGPRVVIEMEANRETNPSIPWPEHLKKTLKRVHRIDKEVDDSPASLIVVMGSSLAVLRNYSFLWPTGLGKCTYEESVVGKKTKKRRRTSGSGEDDDADSEIVACQLAIINLQPTCKDGVASFVCRQPCDDLLRAVMSRHLRLSVPDYMVEKDQLLQWVVPLLPGEEYTRIRPDIPLR